MPVIVALILVIISGLVAAAGDFMGQRAARRKIRIGTLRPRYVSRLIAVVSGILISLATYGALFLLYTDYREALTQYGSVKQRYIEAQTERDRAEGELAGMQGKLKDANAQVASANASVEDANRSITELQNSKIALVKEADAKRAEVVQLAAQKSKAERDLKQTNAQLAGARSDLSKVRSDLRGSQALGAMKLDALRSGDILLPKDTLLARVEVPAAQAGDVTGLVDAALDKLKTRLAAELDVVLDPGTEAQLAAFASSYPYADPPSDGVVLIVVTANVLAKEAVPVAFSAQSGGRLVGSGELLLSLRITDTGARISARGHGPREVAFPDGVTQAAISDALVECGDEFVSAMLDLGFVRPPGVKDEDLAAPILRIAALGSDLLNRERPYIVQLASKLDLTSSQWPSEVTVNVFKEPGS